MQWNDVVILLNESTSNFLFVQNFGKIRIFKWQIIWTELSFVTDNINIFTEIIQKEISSFSSHIMTFHFFCFHFCSIFFILFHFFSFLPISFTLISFHFISFYSILFHYLGETEKLFCFRWKHSLKIIKNRKIPGRKRNLKF